MLRSKSAITKPFSRIQHYIAGKVYLNEEGWKDVQKAIRCFHMAADDGNSYAEYQLGKIFYFGNGIRADREKGLDYLAQSATHGNVYAENLLRVIRQQHIRGAASLIAQLGRMFQEKEQRQDRVRRGQRSLSIYAMLLSKEGGVFMKGIGISLIV